MRRHARLCAGLIAAALSSVFVPSARADTTVVFARYHDQWRPVVKVEGSVPYVLSKESLVRAEPGLYAMREVGVYRRGMVPPVVIQMDHMRVRSKGIEFVGDPTILNREFEIDAVITSPIDLPDVYAVFVFNGQDGRKTVLVREVGDLKSYEPDFFRYHVRLDADLKIKGYKVHFFSRGIEVFFPREGWGYINSEIARHIRAETEGVENQNPRPYVLTPPQVPASVRKSGVRKIVEVHATILANGSVPEAVAEPGTPEDQAHAAVTAVLSSYFLPRIEKGVPTNCKVKIPVVLDPSAAQ
ncbi:hypothetical protein GALL_135470 [mine drainage metagenome]|uniref:TonB C-terminal domain-containing protein n=1 Tax=mine drainage metagenome TaxID=410659 RepID=A0A1J5S8T0_9ZZZZ